MYHRIRDLREDADKTQQDVAQDLGMWLNTYRNYESGNREPPFSFVIQLARYYNVSIDYIAGLINFPEHLERERRKG